MRISQLDPETLTDTQMTELLYKNIQDDNENGDCIFVFGSSKAVEYKLPMAIKLYNEGRANKILFSGGVVWNGTELSEAQLLKEKAIELGIPSEDILIEDMSLNTKENVLASLLVLDRAFGLHNIHRLLVVSTIYHMRRVSLNLKTFMPNWIQYSLCPVNDQTTRQENWFGSPLARKRVELESNKIITYVQKGFVIDCDVEISK